MVETIYILSILFLILSAAIYIYRLIAGPHILDRALVVELVLLLGISLFCFFYVKTKSDVLLDVILVWCIIPFLGTLCLTQYISRGQK